MSKQGDDGSWTEWALPPGASSSWTTAYIGYKLTMLPPNWAPLVAGSLRAAAHWQSDNQLEDGGWGYNPLVGSDADSTAYAILFLSSLKHEIPLAAYSTLANFQQVDGGYCTYLPLGVTSAWNVSHPDVTPIALLAALTSPVLDHYAFTKGLDYVLEQQTSQGFWHSFWWDTCLYATEASLRLLNHLGHQPITSSHLLSCKPRNAFEQALFLSALCWIGDPAYADAFGHYFSALLQGQRSDGSWPSVPILRVTSKDAYTPWHLDFAGKLYADPDRLFTTATVLSVLLTCFPNGSHKLGFPYSLSSLSNE